MVVLALEAIAAGSAAAATARSQALLKQLGVSDAQIAALDKGHAVTSVLPTTDDNDIALVGAIHIAAPASRLAEQPGEIQRSLSADEGLQMGIFSEPPRVEDMEALRFEAPDLKNARTCRPGDCSLKLDQLGIQAVQAIDWRAADAPSRVAARLKARLLEQLVAYRQDGRMPVYVDKDRPMGVVDGLRRSLADSPYLPQSSPFLRYVLDYPKASLAKTEDIFYWSKTQLRKPVTSLHHLIIHRTEEGDSPGYAIADKHISDTHFLRSTVDLLWLIPDAGVRPGFYCVRVNRTRIDPPRVLRGLLMGRIRKGMRSALAHDLERTKLRLELPARGSLPDQVGLPAMRVTGDPPFAIILRRVASDARTTEWRRARAPFPRRPRCATRRGSG
jgi:hypothetical protein